MFRNLRILIGNMIYRNRLKQLQRKRKVHSMQQAHTIGIIYEVDKESYERVRELVKVLKDQKKNVVSLGYINTRYPGFMVHPRLEFHFFDIRNLNLFMVPTGSEVKNFIDEEFHILIDLNLNGNFPLQYVCGLSKANFKVGITSNNQDIYDMMLHIEKKKTLENLIEQVTKYLNMINKPVASEP